MKAFAAYISSEYEKRLNLLINATSIAVASTNVPD